MGVTDNLPKTRPGRATYADIEALPENMVGEILFGVLHVSPRPPPRNLYACLQLGVELMEPFDLGVDGRGDWIFFREIEVHLDDHVIVPDLSGWRRERLPWVPDTAYIDFPPDWVAEFPSPSTRHIDLDDKLKIYAAFGVRHCWYIDPIEKTMDVRTLVDGDWQITAALNDSAPVTATPFEVHTFALDVLWPDAASPEPHS